MKFYRKDRGFGENHEKQIYMTDDAYTHKFYKGKGGIEERTKYGISLVDNNSAIKEISKSLFIQEAKEYFSLGYRQKNFGFIPELLKPRLDEIKSGMLIQYRNGDVGLVVNKTVLLTHDGHMDFNRVDSDLKTTASLVGDSYDIVAVTEVFEGAKIRPEKWKRESMLSHKLLWSEESQKEQEEELAKETIDWSRLPLLIQTDPEGDQRTIQTTKNIPDNSGCFSGVLIDYNGNYSGNNTNIGAHRTFWANDYKLEVVKYLK